jgi:hypothetical protein
MSLTSESIIMIPLTGFSVSESWWARRGPGARESPVVLRLRRGQHHHQEVPSHREDLTVIPGHARRSDPPTAGAAWSRHPASPSPTYGLGGARCHGPGARPPLAP